MGDGRVPDRPGQQICAFLEGAVRARRTALLVPIDSGVTRTDFSDPARPRQRSIGPDGRFTDRAQDGIKTDEECYQAAIRLAEIETSRMKLPEIFGVTAEAASRRFPVQLLRFMKAQDLRVPWLPTDPLLHPEAESPEAARFMRQAIEKAETIWTRTVSENDLTTRRSIFAKKLFEAMKDASFGIRFIDPQVEGFPKRGHPFFSDRLFCLGTWLYGALCRRYGISATPVQLFTNSAGDSQEHVLVGLRLNPKAPDELSLVGLQRGEAQFGLAFSRKASWAPISELELLAYVHLTRAYQLFPDDREKQWQELARAYRAAPHNYVVRYQLAFWNWKKGQPGGDRDEARRHLQRALELNPSYHRSQLLRREMERAGVTFK
jgi:hypothetical protein